MDRFLKIIQAFLAILYIVVNIYLMAFNWAIYSVSLDVDYGFGSFKAPVIFVIAITGIVTILLLWLTGYTKDLINIIRFMKATDDTNKTQSETRTNSKNAQENSLDERISKMQKQIDEMTKLLQTTESHKLDK